MVSSANLLTFAISGNGPMMTPASALSEIRFKGLKGMQPVTVGNEVDLAGSDAGKPSDPGLFCVGGEKGKALWNSSNDEVILTLCTGSQSALSAGILYSVSIAVINPKVVQPAPSLSISARSSGGKVLLDWFPLAKPSASANSSNGFAAAGFTDPLYIVAAGFTERLMAQSNSLASEQNTLTITLQTYIDLAEGGVLFSTFTTSTTAPTFLISGLTGAVVDSSDVTLATPTSFLAQSAQVRDGSLLFCSPEGVAKQATWDSDSHQLKLTLCRNLIFRKDIFYVVSFDVMNPASGQASPDIFISIEVNHADALSDVTVIIAARPGDMLPYCCLSEGPCSFRCKPLIHYHDAY